MKKTINVFLLFLLIFALLPAPVPAQSIPDLSVTTRYVRQVAGGADFAERLDWPILALAGAGENVDVLIRTREQQVRQGQLFDNRRSTDFHRTIVGAVAAGKNPRNFAGLNLVARVRESQLPSGKFADTITGQGERLVNAHIWGIISLYVAGEPIPNSSRALSWLINNQNSDGGFSVDTAIKSSDVDMTGMALKAFAVLGRDRSHPAVKRALDYLQSQQQENGDFSPWSSSGPESIAQAILGLIMLDIDPAGADWSRKEGNLITALLRYRRADGSFSRRPGGEADFISSYQALTALRDVQRSSSIYTLLHRKNAGFSDLLPGHAAYNEIRELVARGILSGYPDGTFRPDNPVRRDEFAKMIVAALGKEPAERLTTARFSDVPLTHWANPYIRAAAANGLIVGKTPTNFAPGDKISGAEVMVILLRALGEGNRVQTIPGEAWYAGHVRLAREKGLTYRAFDAGRPATRAQCAFSLMRLRELL